MRHSVITVAIALAILVVPVHAKPGHAGSLPPGLEKRLEQGKPLPPGWARKLHEGDVLDERIVDRGEIVVPVDDNGVITLEVEGETLRLIEATREIVDILGH